MSLRLVNLPDDLEQFVAATVDSGRYKDPSEVVQAALTSMKVQDGLKELRFLQDAALSGFAELNRGACRMVDPDEFMDEVEKAAGLR